MAGTHIIHRKLYLKDVKVNEETRYGQLVIAPDGEVMVENVKGGYFFNEDVATGVWPSLTALQDATPVTEDLVIGAYADIKQGTVLKRYQRIDGKWIESINASTQVDLASALDRANHTGVQAISTVENLSAQLASKIEGEALKRIVFLPQSEYDALEPKDSETIYLTPIEQ